MANGPIEMLHRLFSVPRTTQEDDVEIVQTPEGAMLEAAWGIIANAGEGSWDRESADWQDAATRWREQYHKWLDTHFPR